MGRVGERVSAGEALEKNGHAPGYTTDSENPLTRQSQREKSFGDSGETTGAGEQPCWGGWKGPPKGRRRCFSLGKREENRMGGLVLSLGDKVRNR